LDFWVYAADGCDPEKCFKFLGCGKKAKPNASIGIDTFSLLRSKQHSFMQINDCPFPLMESVVRRVLNEFGAIDLLFLSYTGAGSYPQCWDNYDATQKQKYGKIKANKMLDWGVKTLNLVKPKYYMPYAGEYTLSGFLSSLEKYKHTPSKTEALEFYKTHYKQGIGFCLNQEQYFDIQTSKTSSQYIEEDKSSKEEYIKKVLSKIKFPYEHDDEVTLSMILELLPTALQRYYKKRKELRFSTKTIIFIYLMENMVLKIHNDSDTHEIIHEENIAKCDRFVTYRMHPKLLLRILKGPRYAHINNAEIGSHIRFTRKPEIYERKLYYSMNFFHG
jgi:UDP-MurNAc hydroxylase